MEIQDLRLGNLIRISPRPNEEGVLFLAEIHPLSIIGVMLIPRQGYHFRIKFNEMLPLNINEEWLFKFGFSGTAGNDVLTDKRNIFTIRPSTEDGTFLAGTDNSEKKVQFVHQLQNLYFEKTGEELSPRL